MPRPKKESLSKAVNPGTKRGNPDFVSSSFYVPKKININFDKALLTLKANGYEIDRSDILTVLMDRFAHEVSAVEARDDEMDLEAILNRAQENLPEITAEVSGLKRVLRESVEEVKLQKKETSAMLEVAMEKMSGLDDDQLRSSGQEG